MRGINEVIPIIDTLCSGCGAIEKLEGDLFRFWMFVSVTAEDSDAKEKVLVAKIVMSKAVIPDAILQTIAAITDCGSMMPLVAELMH